MWLGYWSIYDISHIIIEYEEITYQDHYRTENKTADLLANMAMDRKEKSEITQLMNEIEIEKQKF